MATSSVGIASLAAPFAIDEQISITLGADSEVQFRRKQPLIPVPEPMSTVLLGSVILTIGLVTGSARRLRRFNQLDPIFGNSRPHHSLNMLFSPHNGEGNVCGLFFGL